MTYPKPRVVAFCPLCGSSSLEALWRLPNYPFTEQFGFFDDTFPSEDLDLLMCSKCHHVQLATQVSPDFLYTEANYNLATQKSPKIAKELGFLADFVRRVGPQDSRLALEFGANNLEFANVLVRLGYEVIACDPLVPASANTPGITTFRGRIEEMLAAGLVSESSLVVARHTLEHIADPTSTIEALFEASPHGVVLVFEVPSLRHLSSKLRFDAVIHQHYHYFSEKSVQQLAARTASVCVASAFNENGSNGGSLLFALSRPGRAHDDALVRQNLPGISAEGLKSQISQFTRRMEKSAAEVRSLDPPLYGFGASLMLATQNYHMRGVIEDLTAVFDDDSSRSGTTYKNLQVLVRQVGADFPADVPFLVTSLENAEAIASRLRQLGVARILSPLA